ncbi:MAG: DUF1289 domain-containing protein [Gammaproteobacteria bacterium]|nr:MAG: DUF1289 domain-containing protein [Gammaproteobacteria bacterium]
MRSPCVNICSLDEHDVCIGCHRTGQEIVLWSRMTEEEKRQVLKKVAEREKSSIL